MKRCLHCNSPMTFDKESLVYICDLCGREFLLDEMGIELSDFLKEKGEEW